MSMRLSAQRAPRGTSAAGLRKWALIFLTAGGIGQGLIQNRLLNMDVISANELLEHMQADPAVMTLVTIALVCKVMETCAVPLFSFLLVEGFLRTRSFEKYLIRVGAVALISELPYNLAMGSGIINLSSRNPALSLLIALVMLYFFNRFGEKCFKNTAMKALIFLAAVLWCGMLRIDHGVCVVVMVCFLWYVREKGNVRAMFGFLGSMVCTMFNMYYIASGLACIMLHRYDEERGEQNALFNYAFYPALLLIVGVLGNFLV